MDNQFGLGNDLMSNVNCAEVDQQKDFLEFIRTDFDNNDNQQNQRPGAIEQVEGCTLRLSSASRRENIIASKSLHLFEGSEIQQNDQPRASGMLHNQTIDPNLQLASAASSVAPLTNNFGPHAQSSPMEQPGEKEKSEIDTKERRRLCQKRFREKQKQEALEIKEKLKKATRENDDLKREIAELEKTIKTQEEMINELRKRNHKLQNDNEKLQENANDLEIKNEKLKGKNQKLQGKNQKLKQNASDWEQKNEKRKGKIQKLKNENQKLKDENYHLLWQIRTVKIG